MTRQQARREIFDRCFVRHLCTKKSPIPQGLLSRHERRNLARAYACRDWKRRRNLARAYVCRDWKRNGRD
jgi:hypothetical protein